MIRQPTKEMIKRSVISLFYVTQSFEAVEKGSVISVVRRKNTKGKSLIRKTGTCIYKDDKLIVLKMKNYSEAFNLEGFINYWKIERVEDGKCCSLFV